MAASGRFRQKTVDVGLGPQPLINNLYHKAALELLGYSCETFVTKTYYITDRFDVNLAKAPFVRVWPGPLRNALASLLAFNRIVSRYRAIYIYFNGGPLAALPGVLGELEPFLYRLAGVRVVVMPYGTDVQDMTRSPNLLFKHVQALSYPNFRLLGRQVARNIDLWTDGADHVIGGVEWVDYMRHWDTLMLGHFCIDTDAVRPSPATPPYDPGRRPLRLVHAPNHRHIKATDAFIAAVDELRCEGLEIELELLERRPNNEVLAAIARADVVLDQLVVGWYAMFAIEAMAMAKPVVCFLRPDLVAFYRQTRLLDFDEPPILSADVLSIKSVLRSLAQGGVDLASVGDRSRAYVVRHHALARVGSAFDRINRSLGVAPARTASAVHSSVPDYPR